MKDYYEKLYNCYLSELQEENIEKIDKAKLISGIVPYEILMENILNDKKFWHQKNESEERYKALVLNYQKAQTIITAKGTLEHLSLTDPVRMAYQAFHSDPITLIKHNGRYLFNGNNGRHRIIAAQLLAKQGFKINLTALVTEYKSKNNLKESSNFLIKTTNMGYEIERQVELLTDAKNTFISHSQQLENLLTMFNSTLKSFEMDNLNHDYQDFLEEFNNEYSGQLKKMMDIMDEEYIPAIQRKINYLEERE